MPRRPHPLLLDVGRRVAELRRAQGWTQEKFAERAEVSVGYVREVEGGHENLSLLSLAKIAALLGVSVPDLLVAPASRAVRRGRPPRVSSSANSASSQEPSQAAGVPGDELRKSMQRIASLVAEQDNRGEVWAARTQVKEIFTALERAIHESQVSGEKTHSKRRERAAPFLSKVSKMARDFLTTGTARVKPGTTSQRRRMSK